MSSKIKKIGFDIKSKDQSTKFDKDTDTDADKTGTDKKILSVPVLVCERDYLLLQTQSIELIWKAE